jgi:GT2 family glycosyltransferase
VKQQLPFFSVIVPTYNRPAQLKTCLQALAAQRYPRDRFEVLVVDDGSAEPPRAVVGSFTETLNVTLLSEPHGGPSAARNAGAARARGEFLAFTDDDCAPTTGWLENIAARMGNSPACLVGGLTINALTENIYSAASQGLIDVIYAHFNRDPANAQFLASNNIAMPPAQFHAIGGFNSSFHFAEDREFCDRWLRDGYRMTYAPEVVIHHRHYLTLRSLWRQHFNYGRGAFLFHRISGPRGTKFRFESAFYLSIFRFPLSNGVARTLFMEFLMVEMQLANAAGFFIQAAKGRVV